MYSEPCGLETRATTADAYSSYIPVTVASTKWRGTMDTGHPSLGPHHFGKVLPFSQRGRRMSEVRGHMQSQRVRDPASRNKAQEHRDKGNRRGASEAQHRLSVESQRYHSMKTVQSITAQIVSLAQGHRDTGRNTTNRQRHGQPRRGRGRLPR